MKRLLLCFMYSIVIVCAYSQGPQQLVSFPVEPGGAPVKGWIYIPADYDKTTQNYPVVVFYHGLGEAGTDPYRVLNQGIPKLIAGGMRPDSILNPDDGKKYSFIVLSMQHWAWSPDPAWLPMEVEWLKQNYRIDTNRVYVTGLSAGGQQSFNVAVDNDAVSSLIAAAVPMSPPLLSSYNIGMVSKYHIKTWFLSGSTDAYTNNAIAYNNDCNAAYSNSSKLTIYPGGHCCWNTYYNINWHDTTSGLSIWQWFLTTNRRPQIANLVLPVKFTNFKATDLGNKQLKIEFNYENPDGDEDFHIQLKIRGMVKDILMKPEDKTGTNKYSKTINVSL